MIEAASITLFVLSAGAIFYVLFGYPIVVGILARLRRRDVHKAPVEKSVSFILPVHNGEAFLADKLRSIFELHYPESLIEILVISDGSEDASENIAESFAERGVRLIRLPRGGKAKAINRAIAEARNDILVLTDVRQMLARDSLRRLLEPFADPNVGVVSGNLFIREGERIQEADIGLYRRYEAWIRTQLSAYRSVLGASGCYYAMRRDLARSMPDDTLLDDVYLPLCAIFSGYRCILEPSARCFDLPTALDSEFRRKVRTQAGVYQLIGFFPALLAPWNATGFHFLSLKAGRLFLPFAFIILLATSFGLPAPWNFLALLAQGAFYAVAALDLIVPEGAGLKRLTSPFRSFLVLIASAACAIKICFVRPQDLWKQTVVSKAKSAS